MALNIPDIASLSNRPVRLYGGLPLGLSCARNGGTNMKQIRIGLIGTGYIGMVHLEMLRRLGGGRGRGRGRRER